MYGMENSIPVQINQFPQPPAFYHPYFDFSSLSATRGFTLVGPTMVLGLQVFNRQLK